MSLDFLRFLDLSNCLMIAHIIIEWLGLEGILRDHLVHTPAVGYLVSNLFGLNPSLHLIWLYVMSYRYCCVFFVSSLTISPGSSACSRY